MKRILFISLSLALILTVLAPVSALAAKPVDFNAYGEIDGISDGTVLPAGESGRWRVVERDVTGSLAGAISGDFVMTYRANVELETQAGNLHGTMEVGDDYVVKLNGKISPLEMVWVEDFGTDLPKVTFAGHWTFIDGAKGNGDFEAFAIFIPDEYGHVVYIVASAFVMTGQWH